MQPTKITYIFLLIQLLGVYCFSESNQDNRETNKGEGQTDSVFLINLSDDISIHWDNRSQSIVKDSLLSTFAASFSKHQQSIVNLILSDKSTPARLCATKRNLTVGDLAFLLIDNIKGIPYFQALGVQWDFFSANCRYPGGMFDYIDNYRSQVKSKVESYLTSQ